MSTIGPEISEGTVGLSTWVADKVLGGVKRALGWGWNQAQWAAAQDRYDERIIADYGQVRIFGQTTPKSLRDIFTDVYVLDKPSAHRRFDPKTLADYLWSEERNLPFRHAERQPGEQLLNRGTKFLILGKPGSGKTTFLKHLAVREAQRGRWGSCLGKVPIFVSLREFAEAGQTLFDFIVRQFDVCYFPDAAPFIEGLLESGQALVLFDGLDEVSTAEGPQANRRAQVTDLLAYFCRQYHACHIIITCRIAALEYTFDPAFTYLEMSDFVPEQVEAFVRNWFWDAAEPDKSAARAAQMLSELHRPEHKSIRDLARNPLLLTLLCLNYAETLSFPARRVEIYEEALDALLKKWDSSRQIQRGGLYRALSLGRKRQMFARIAYDAFVRDAIVFSQRDLEADLTAYLQHVPELPTTIELDAEAVLQEIIAQHGIFALQAHALYSFAHLTFQEYYAARYIVDNTSAGTLDTLLSHIENPKWREVFLLTASLLPDATAFLAAFETGLHRLLARRPRVVAWLRHVGTHAQASQAGYRSSATRVWYALDFDGDLADWLDLDTHHGSTRDVVSRLVTLSRFFNRDRDHALDRSLALDFALATNLVLTRSAALSHNRNRPLALSGDKTWNDLLQLCQKQGRSSLYTALSALPVPSVEAEPVTRERFAAALGQIIEMDGALRRYRQLQAETVALTEQGPQRGAFDQDDTTALAYYATAALLFYDCLQLAYVSDRATFEDRIFLPPP